MKRILLLFSIALLLNLNNASGQNISQSFEENNFKWFQSTSGVLFYDQDNGLGGMTVPAGGENLALFSSTFWVAGLDGDDVKASYSYYCNNSEASVCDSKWGPLRTADAQTSFSIAEEYNRFWFVTQSEIDLHLNYYNCLNDQSCNLSTEFPIGYELPESFETWPAHGPEGYADNLAPFVDYNTNEIYDPQNGDYPAICGDFSSYIIKNDVGTEITNDSITLGIEIHTRVYGYNASEGALFNTLFVQHKIINRSETTFTDSYLSTFTDFDLGNYSDDFIGTDVKRSMYFVVNGDDDDEGSTAGPGYGTDLPMLGVKYLGGPFKDDDGVDNAPVSNEFETYGNQTSGWGDGVVDNERLGLSSSLFVAHVNHPGMVQTYNTSAVYNKMKGIWNDGFPLTYGGDGYNPESDTVTRYLYPGDSDPLFVGTNGENPNYPLLGGWTEESGGLYPGDRRMLGSTGPFTFSPGDVQYLDYAIVFARESHNPDLDLRDILNQYADEIVGMECGMMPDIVTGIEESTPKLRIEFFPNPAENELIIKSYSNKSFFTIFDLEGRRVMQGKLTGLQTVLTVESLNAGMYLLKVQSNDGVVVKKIVIK